MSAFPFKRPGVAQDQPSRPIESDGSRAYDEAMSERIAKLEQTVETIRAEMRANTAEIKEIVNSGLSDIKASAHESLSKTHEAISGLKSWLIGTLLTLVGLAVANATLFKSQSPAASPQAPIVIQVPAFPAASLPAPPAPAAPTEKK